MFKKWKSNWRRYTYIFTIYIFFINNFIYKNKLDWKECTNVCASTVGKMKGVVACILKVAINTTKSHCFAQTGLIKKNLHV